MKLNMSYHTTFLNGLQAKVVPALHFRPALLKQCVIKQLCIDLTNKDMKSQKRNKRWNREGINSRNKQRKTKLYTRTIPEDQKKLIKRCIEITKAKDQPLSITKLQNSMGLCGKQSKFQNHLKN